MEKRNRTKRSYLSDILMIWESMSSSEVVSNGQFSLATWPQEGTFLTCQVFIDWDFIHQWYIASLCLLISSHLLQMAGSERNHTGSFSQMPMSRLLETIRQPLGEKRKKKTQSLPTSATTVVSQPFSLSLFFNNFIYLFLAVLGLPCCEDLSLVVESGGYSLVALHKLLMAAASLVAEL